MRQAARVMLNMSIKKSAKADLDRWYASVVKQVDAPLSKSGGGNSISVRIRALAPMWYNACVKTLYTVGHSTKSINEFVDVIKDIDTLVDIRSFPGSRRNPQFNKEALSQELIYRQNTNYKHLPSLGGFRKNEGCDLNTGWKVASFRHFANYMQTEDFQRGIEQLSNIASESRTAIMCSEALWWRCHRRMVSDQMVANGWEVIHLGLGPITELHEMTPFAVVGKTITYPKGDESVQRNVQQ